MSQETEGIQDETINAVLERLDFPSSESDEMRASIQAVQNVTPGVLPLALQFMSSGSLLARTSATTDLRDLLRGISSNKADATKWWQTHEDVYRELVAYYMDMPIMQKMTLRWNYNNVAAALGMSKQDVDMTIQSAIEDNLMPSDKEHAEEYWRGVSIFYIARDNSNDEHPDDHGEFIRWAASRDDFTRIVPLVQERGHFRVEELSAVMEQQDRTAAAIRNGVL